MKLYVKLVKLLNSGKELLHIGDINEDGTIDKQQIFFKLDEKHQTVIVKSDVKLIASYVVIINIEIISNLAEEHVIFISDILIIKKDKENTRIVYNETKERKSILIVEQYSSVHFEYNKIELIIECYHSLTVENFK